MARNEIVKKLDKELQKDINEENQVVYILSRIRKLIEIKNLQQKYKVLKFYCDWALHSVISYTKPVEDILDEFISDRESRVNFLYFKHFVDEFGEFAGEHNITSSIFKHKKLDRFLELLAEVLSDTPIIFKTPKRTAIITLTSVKLDGSYSGIGYSIKYQ